MITCFMISAVSEAGGHRWQNRRLPVLKKGKESERFLVCLKDGDVIIASYEKSKKRFNIPGVIAWRKLPKRVHRFSETYMPWRHDDEEN